MHEECANCGFPALLPPFSVRHACCMTLESMVKTCPALSTMQIRSHTYYMRLTLSCSLTSPPIDLFSLIVA